MNKNIVIGCGSTDEYGDLSDCIAFISKEMLKDGIELAEKYQSNMNDNSPCKSMDFYSDIPVLFEGREEIEVNNTGLLDDLFGYPIKFSDELPCDENLSRVSIEDVDLVINSMWMYWRMEVSNCSTVVTTNGITIETAREILKKLGE